MKRPTKRKSVVAACSDHEGSLATFASSGGGLAAVFKVLANDTRLRLVHALVLAEELCVSDLSARIGMKPQAVSNQLQRLADLGIIASVVKDNILYHVVDVCVQSLLEQAICLMEEVNVLCDCPVRKTVSR